MYTAFGSSPLHLSSKGHVPSSAVAVPDVSIPDVGPISQGPGSGLRKRKAAVVDTDVGRRESKRARPSVAALSSPISNSSSNELDSLVPLSSPVWVTRVVKLFARDDFGAEWRGLVGDWLRYEQATNFVTSRRLGSKGRPQAVADWIQRARSETFHPTVNVPKFKADFWNWWSDLQPAWRLVDGEVSAAGHSSSWDGLSGIKGTNGFVSVLVVLAFWHSGLSSGGVGDATLVEWLGAVNDVHQVIQELSK